MKTLDAVCVCLDEKCLTIIMCVGYTQQKDKWIKYIVLELFGAPIQ